MLKGKFISLEGGEGSGKSTSMAFISEWLEKNNINYIATREPGGTEFAEEIRALFLKRRTESVHDLTELLLVFAARVQHINEKIKPALDQGIWVLSDRFIDSSYVYQGVARQGNLEQIDTLSSWVLKNCKPDLTLLFDVPVDIGMQRVGQRGKSDRLDAESTAFHQVVRDAFLDRARVSEHHVIIDASQSIVDVNRDILSCLNKLAIDY